MSKRYDSDEAIFLLGRAYGRMKESDKEREAAVVELIDAVLGLDGEAGFKVERIQGRPDLLLSHGGGSVLFGWQGDCFKVWREHRFFPKQVTHVMDIPLVYNGAFKQFEGAQEDTFHIPTPGMRQRRRSALAVVVEMASAVIAKNATD